MSMRGTVFLVLAFSICWLMAGLFTLFGGRWNSPASTAMGTLYMFGPAIAAMIMRKLVCNETEQKPLGVSFRLNRWFLVAWLLPPAIAFATIGVSLTLPGVEYAPGLEGVLNRFGAAMPAERAAEVQGMIEDAATWPVHPVWLFLLLGLRAGVTINAVAGFGEELGWRGFLLREWAYMGFWRSSILIGFVWGVWHAPLILHGHNYPQHPVAGVFMMTVLCVLLAPIFSYVRLRADSIIAVSIMHGTLNATYGLALVMIDGGTDLLVGVTGLSGFVVLAVLNATLYVYDGYFAKCGISLCFPDGHSDQK